jgi:hypothetical protein
MKADRPAKPGPPAKPPRNPATTETTEATNVRCTETAAATETVTATLATVTATATPSKGRSRNQRGADHGRHGDRDQFFVNHRDPPFVEASPLCVIYRLLSELNTDIPVTRITIADHDFPPRGFPTSGMPGYAFRTASVLTAVRVIFDRQIELPLAYSAWPRKRTFRLCRL